MATTTARKPRAMEKTATAQVEIPQDIKDNAAFFYTDNKKASAFGTSAKKFRAKLLGLMKGLSLTSLHFSAPVGGTVETRKGGKTDGQLYMSGGTLTPLVVEVKTPKNRVVDIELLSKKVDMATLLKIVSATQKACEEHVSKSVLETCLVEVDGTENVSVEVG